MEVDRARLRAVLRHRYPWVADPQWGPSTVVAGECDVCGAEARLVAPCGPPPAAPHAVGADWGLGRRCAVALGADAWCGGHADDAGAAVEWCGDLPPEADDVARLWWVATGEVRVDPALVVGRLPLAARAELEAR